MTQFYPRMVLGLGGDGPTFPHTPIGNWAVAGQAVVGPLQLLALCEIALGLSGPTLSVANRVACWRSKLAAAGPGRFWAKSFESDALATARLLLEWRDALVAAGWTAAAVADAPKRLADLAAAESNGGALPPGFADRLCAAISRLSDAPRVIGELILIEPRDLLPRGLSRLVDAFETNGSRVLQAARTTPSAKGDLARVQAAVQDGGSPAFANDGSFAVLSASTEIGAAEVLADWLMVAPEAKGAVLIADRETGALDAALLKRGLPPVGRSEASTHRGILQVLPLVFAIRWAPFDALRMLEFLQLPQSPLPFAVRQRLSDSLQEAPGRGGRKWREAIDAGLAEEAARVSNTATAKVRTARARQQVETLLEGDLLDPRIGISLAAVTALCALVTTWAGPRAESDPLAHRLVGAATALSEAAAATGVDPISRLDFERLLEQVLEDGVQDPRRLAGAAPWLAVNSPAAVWGECDTLIWWGVSPQGRVRRSPWTEEETAALTAAGCPPDDPLISLRASVHGWRNVILHAKNKVLLIPAPSPGAEEAAEHPLLQELGSALGKSPQVRPVAETLLATASASLLGVRLLRTARPLVHLPQPRRTWSIAAGDRRQRTKESATSIGQLLACPYAWLLRYKASLKPGRQASIPSADQMIGTLAHALIERLFPVGSSPKPSEVLAAAKRVSKPLIEELAAPLLAPGQAAECARVLTELPEAAKSLAELLQAHRLVVDGVEVERTALDMPSEGTEFSGRIDMLLKDPSGRPIILDLKWSRRDKYRQEEIVAGAAIQLAAYTKAIGAGEAAGYYMLAQRRVIGRRGGVPGGMIDGAPELTETWSRVIESIHLREATLADGRLHAIGVDYDRKKPPPDPDQTTVKTSPPCRFCDFGHLCGEAPAR